jgi:hypothetical protein
METGKDLRLEPGDGQWRLAGAGADRFGPVNEYLGYLADRNYSPRPVRTYGYDLLAFCRWLREQDMELASVGTDGLLHYLSACRRAQVPGRPGPNVVTMQGRRLDRYAPTTINQRLAAISGLYAFLIMRNPELKNPVPRGKEARRPAAGERTGLLAHVAKPKPRSVLRLREPRRLPRALKRSESAALLASLHCWRDRAIAGLMLFCGLRLSDALELEKPIFMGSSFGGNIALQLAYRFPERFDAVIPVEGADYSPGFYLDWWQHPHANAAQVCASGVWELMAPQSPEKDRWKTWFYYTRGSEAFKGDLYFYSVDHDLRGKLGDVDTDKCAVVLMTGECDYLTTPEDGARTASEIRNA